MSLGDDCLYGDQLFKTIYTLSVGFIFSVTLYIALFLARFILKSGISLSLSVSVSFNINERNVFFYCPSISDFKNRNKHHI